MNTKWPKGSEWRKWDLHIHAPGTKLKNAFKDAEGDALDAYCQRLHDSDVFAFGITDYFSADCYFKVVERYRELYTHSEKAFFPNVEVRLNESVNKKQEEINLHLIFNPFMLKAEEGMRKFLQTLKTNRTDGNGRHVRAEDLTSQREVEAATTTREYIREALQETFGQNADLLDHVLIVVAVNSDGIRPERGKHRKAQISDEVDKFSDALFGNPGNVAFFLETDRYEEKSQKSEPKPVLTGCDAHSFDDLDQRLGQVTSHVDTGTAHTPTWIKADLTYEGLKQIIFEPENRVYIGEEPGVLARVKAHPTRYVKSVQVTKASDYSGQHGTWFDNEEIVFNKELVAVIGNKGSGKSAVTDIVGLLGNSHNQTGPSSTGRPEELFSFLNKEKFLKGKLANHFIGTLEWYNGNSDPKTLDARIVEDHPERVEYLPQKYLERLCANISDDEFRKKLNEVVFRYVKEKDRHGYDNLDELLQYRSQQTKAEIDELKESLHGANRDVVRIERKLTDSYLADLDENIKLMREEVESHWQVRPERKRNPAYDAESTADETNRIEAVTQQIDELAQRIAILEEEQRSTTRLTEQLRQARQAIEREASRLRNLEIQYEAVLGEIDLQFEDIVKVELDFEKLDQGIVKGQQRLSELEPLLLSVDEIESSYPDDEAARTAAEENSLVIEKSRLEDEKRKAIVELVKPEREYQQYLSDVREWRIRWDYLCGEKENPELDTLRGLKRERRRIKNVYPGDLEAARSKRIEMSKKVFAKKRELMAFYNEIKRSIDREIEKCQSDLGEYLISIEAGLRFDPEFFEDFLRFINQSAAGSFRGVDEGRMLLQQFIDEITDFEGEDQVFSALEQIMNALHSDARPEVENKRRNVFNQMKGSYEVEQLYDYLFAVDYLEPKYDLKVDKKYLRELSPGERGGLLLIFYLMLDRQEIPLIIDQPEDNLDNESVYKILARFIKQAKQRRQIILVTHNPNLAVVADAEQIIHVDIDKKDGKHDFNFASGSIEDPDMNERVVNILEGTLPAFDNRRLKYRKPRQ